SLAALLMPVGIFAVLTYHRNKLLDIRAALVTAVGLATTTLIGAQITLALPDTLFKQAYGVFVIIMGLRFLDALPRLRATSATPETRDTSDIPTVEQQHSTLRFL